MTIIALLTISLGALGTTQMSATWQLFLLWGVVVGLGSGCMAAVFASTVVSRWFVARRGLVMGILAAGTASGQLVFLPLLSRLAEGAGWRWVGFTIALCALGVVPIVLLFLRDRPSDLGLLPHGATEAPAPDPQVRPIQAAFGALGDAWHSGTFWLLFGSFFHLRPVDQRARQTHFVSAAGDHGYSSTVAAGYLALIGIFDVIGTVGSGWMTDRVDPRKLLLGYYLLRGLSLMVIDPALAMGGSGLIGFMVFYGLDWVATVPPTVALCINGFGLQRGPLVFGWVFAGHQMGAAVAAWGAGELRDITGSYQPAFIIAGIGCLIAAVGVTRIRWDRPPRLDVPIVPAAAAVPGG